MMPQSTNEILQAAIQRGYLSSEIAETIAQDVSVPGDPDRFKTYLIERQLLTLEQWNTLMASSSWIELQSAVTAPIALDEPMPLFNVPVGHDDNAYVPESIPAPDDNGPTSFVPSLDETVSKPMVRRHIEAPMTRETMWKWIGIGGTLWLLGFLVLGAWLGGCFQDTPKIKSKPKSSQSK
jgi:hypothetical protein